MRFLCIYSHAKPEGAPPSPDEMSRLGSLIEEMSKAGVLEATEGCKASAFGARVRQVASAPSVLDGPFTESQNHVGGYAIIKTASKADAIAWVKRFLAVVGDGESEMCELLDR